MFEKLKSIFSGSKDEATAVEMKYEEIRPWLDEMESRCTGRRTEAMNESRDTIISHRDSLLTLIHEFGVESPDDQPRHHKVEQVNRHVLPQFCKRIETELDRSFSSDDEDFYQEVAGMVQGCFKAYKGPGRYLHHIYSDEIHFFRETLDSIGKELNRLTDIVRASRTRIGEIEAVRTEIRVYTEIMDEESVLSTTAERNRETISEREKELSSVRTSLSHLLSTPAYREFLTLQAEHVQAMQSVSAHREALDALFRTAIPVWRKAERIFHDTGADGDARKVSEMIHLAGHHEYADSSLSLLITGTTPAIFEKIASEAIPIKNAFEKGLFTTPDEYSSRINSSLSTFFEAETHAAGIAGKLASDPAGEEERSLKKKEDDLIREIELITGELTRSYERRNHLISDRMKAETRIRDLVGNLSDEPVTVIFPPGKSDVP